MSHKHKSHWPVRTVQQIEDYIDNAVLWRDCCGEVFGMLKTMVDEYRELRGKFNQLSRRRDEEAHRQD